MDLSYVLGGGLEPPRLTAYAPQTYVSAISPPERFRGTQLVSCRRLPASDLSSISTADGQSGAVSPPVASNQSAICLTIRSTRPSVTSTTSFGRIDPSTNSCTTSCSRIKMVKSPYWEG